MKMKKIWKAAILTLFFIAGKLSIDTAIAQKLDRAAFYAAMKSGTKDDIDKLITTMGEQGFKGYKGALIIREAGLPGAKGRLKMFKEGKAMLEADIAAHPDNPELRFLRLSIQERSPRIVGYKGDMKKDKEFLISHFDELPPVVQTAIKDYSKESKTLKSTDF